MSDATRDEVQIELPGVGVLGADLVQVAQTGPVVVFAHGSGSSRHSPRNQQVARRLQQDGFGTLLLDLLTPDEERVEQRGGMFRFDVQALAERLAAAVEWLGERYAPRVPAVGYFGASTGAAAALIAAARQDGRISAVVSRGGRPDLAADALPDVTAPTLLIVGGSDRQVLALNQEAFDRLSCVKRLDVVPGATHLFEEPGTLEQVCELAAAWFGAHMPIGARSGARS